MNRKPRVTAAVLVLPFCFSFTSVLAQDEPEGGPLSEDNFSSTLYLTSDYVFRGVSFSDEDFALQGSFDYAYNNFFAGVWGSSINGPDYDLELDYYAGYANSWNGIDYSIQPIYYNFPASNDSFGGLETDQFEVWATLGRGFSSVPLAPYVSVLYAWSPDFTLEDGTGNYVLGSVALTLPAGFGLDFGIGYQDVEGDGATGDDGLFCDPTTGTLCDGYSYTHYTAGVTQSWKGFNFDLRYHDTDEDDEHVAFLGTDDLAEARVVFTVSRSF